MAKVNYSTSRKSSLKTNEKSIRRTAHHTSLKVKAFVYQSQISDHQESLYQKNHKRLLETLMR